MPRIVPQHVNDAIVYIYKWLSAIFDAISPALFFEHVLTVATATADNNRRRFFVMYGEPFAGKRTLIGMLDELLLVHRLVMIKADELDRQLVYTQGAYLVFFNDMKQDGLRQLLENRSILDGQPITASRKFEHAIRFLVPGIVVCTNSRLVKLFKPAWKEDEYYHMKTHGYYWECVCTQPEMPDTVCI